MATAATIDRCQRCATKIRNRRTICPSCGHDLHAAPEPEPAAEAPPQQEPAPSAPAPRRAQAKAGVKMCGICMASVPEEQMVEDNGQKICPDCAENIKNKAMKKAAGGGPPKA
ncbi:MAG TPA: hypothetical protein VEJ63_20635 [Planctomycetota bacterium]|nr:hypothetical protein [Planctomycetota bacterium]